MGFRFRFERLLTYKEENEKNALVAMAKIERRRDQERKGQRILEGEVQKLGGEREALKGRSILMEEIHLLHSRWAALQADLKRQRSVADEWEVRLYEARGRWLDARKARKVLMLLKDRDLERFLGEVRKAEAQHLDEVSLRPYLEGAPRGERGVMGINEGSTSKT
jgi:flagellar export protein FliJ